MSSIQGPRGPLAKLVPSNQFARRSDEDKKSDRGNLAGSPVRIMPGDPLPQSESSSSESKYLSFDSSSSGSEYCSLEPVFHSSERPRSLESRRPSVVDVPVNIELAQEARYYALPIRDQLIDKAGPPKENIKYLNINYLGPIPIPMPMSGSYKSLLKELDDYHKDLNSDKPVTRGRLKGLLGKLETLQKRANSYVADPRHGRIDKIKDLRYQIDCNVKLLDDVLAQIAEDGSDWPAGVSLRDGTNFARQGVAVKDLGTFLAQDLRDWGMSAKDLRPYRDKGFSGAEARLLHESGLGLEGGQMYLEANLKVTKDTLLDRNLTSKKEKAFKELGSGAFNTVSEVKYKNGEVGVFKPLPKIDARKVEGGWVADRTGIDVRSPQTALRNLATFAVAKKLGFNIVPETRIAEHLGQLGILMGRAPGMTGKKTWNTDRSLFNNPKVRRELTKLQLLDALVGQGDRHWNNYFIHTSPSGRVTVTGIDNDQCFGRKVTDPNGIAYRNTKDADGFRGVLLPPVVDREMANAFDQLTPDDLDDLLGDKLSRDEVDAAKQRLQGIKVHIEELRDKRWVIYTDEWGEKDVAQRLTPKNSYAARDAE
jgi:hypothetical protein